MADESDTGGAARAATVFLSYARADQARATQLAAALRAAGLTVWWDALIEGGTAFAASIADALDTADAVLVLWSEASIASDWVRDEAAQGRDRRRLVPLLLDASKPPLGFRQYQAIDLSAWRGDPAAPQVAAILRAIVVACGRPMPALPSPVASGVPRRRALAIAAGAVASAVGGTVAIGWRGGWFAAADDSLAILPFKALGSDPAQAWFTEGLTEEFRATLARNPALRVMAGVSTAAAGEDAATVARRLAVAYVLAGTVRRDGDMVRISADLVDRSGFTRWSQSFDRRLTDIFAVQTEIAGLVAQALAIRVATTRPAPGGTAVVPAYEAYLRGRAQFNAAKDEASDRAALEQFEMAIAADTGFALAHAARSRSLAAIAAEYATAGHLRPLFDAALDAARRAVALAPDLAEAQAALGYAQFVGHLDVPGARAAYDQARALGHGDADILLLFALYAVRAGRGGDAVAAITRALALDPLNPRTHRAAGSISYGLRRYGTALGQLRQAVALNPAISNARALIGSCRYQQGQVAAARAAFAAEPHANFRLTGLAIADHRLGSLAAARRAMADLVATAGDSALYQQAEVLAQWGESGPALAALERARAIGDSGLLYLATDPMLEPLAKEPRFRALLRELHLG
ncbi:TIR domain-containing protein [uncultured Sphingomonas sp.]|uniref:TIR domain-containing protein n=1 Tax=uncultured Sphingomonas sp. TaxID=158754 RepID=UPI0035CA8ABC